MLGDLEAKVRARLSWVTDSDGFEIDFQWGRTIVWGWKCTVIHNLRKIINLIIGRFVQKCHILHTTLFYTSKFLIEMNVMDVIVSAIKSLNKYIIDVIILPFLSTSISSSDAQSAIRGPSLAAPSLQLFMTLHCSYYPSSTRPRIFWPWYHPQWSSPWPLWSLSSSSPIFSIYLLYLQLSFCFYVIFLLSLDFSTAFRAHAEFIWWVRYAYSTFINISTVIRNR